MKLTVSQAIHLRRAIQAGRLDVLSKGVRGTTVRSMVRDKLLMPEIEGSGLMARYFVATQKGIDALRRFEGRRKSAA